jgi:hypothetical protein
MGIFQSVSLSKLSYSLYPTLSLRKLRQRPLKIGNLGGYVYSFDCRTKTIVAVIEYGTCHALCVRFVHCFIFGSVYKYDSSFVVSTPYCRHILDVKARDIAVKGTYYNLKENYLEKVPVFYEEIGDNKERDECVVCLDRVSIIMINCGHKCMCRECFNDYYFSKQQLSKTCPMCRVDIHSYMVVGE